MTIQYTVERGVLTVTDGARAVIYDQPLFYIDSATPRDNLEPTQAPGAAEAFDSLFTKLTVASEGTLCERQLGDNAISLFKALGINPKTLDRVAITSDHAIPVRQ